MRFKRDKPSENEVTDANPVPLPNLPSLNEILEGLDSKPKVEPVVTADFLAAAKEVMEQHKATLEKLEDDKFTEVALGLVRNKEGQYDVVQFAFDPRTLVVSKDVQITRTGDTSKLVGIERLEIMLANLIISKHLYS